MTTLDLSSYSSVYTAYFVKLVVTGYATMRMSTHYKPYDIDESGSVQTYQNLGDLISISDSTSSIKANPEQITITLSGIPAENISIVVDQAIKGSSIEVRKLYMNGATYQAIGAPIIKFKGIVENYNVTEEYPQDNATPASCSVGLICSTLFDMYQNKRAGRRTNPVDEKLYFPLDLSMDRVPTVTGSNYNFGAPR